MYQTAIRTSRSVGISARSSVSHVTGHPPVRHANSHVRTSSCRHNGSHIADLTPQQQALQTQQHWNKAGVPLLWQAAAVTLVQLHLALAGHTAELIEGNVSNEGNVPSELSAAGEPAAPKLSALLSGSNRKQVEGCTRKCVPTCVRGGEGAPGLGPISMRKEIVVFKQGFRSRQYCLSECAQVCSHMINKDSSSSSSGGGGEASSSSQQQAAATGQQSPGVALATAGATAAP